MHKVKPYEVDPLSQAFRSITGRNNKTRSVYKRQIYGTDKKSQIILSYRTFLRIGDSKFNKLIKFIVKHLAIVLIR